MADKKKEEEKLYSEEEKLQSEAPSDQNYSGSAPGVAAPLAAVAPTTMPAAKPMRPNPIVAPPAAPVTAPAYTPPTNIGQGGPQNQQVAQSLQELNQGAAEAAPYDTTNVSGTPRQLTADELNNLEKQKNLEAKRGQIEADTAAQISRINQAEAAENMRQSTDFDALQKDNLDRYNTADANNQADVQKYRSVAGNLKDPSSQFWEDKGTGARIVGALAAFSSGMGAGLLGHAGNPFLDFLNKQIEGNYQAHKQNVEDLYNAAVASGKITDSVESHNRFRNEAKLKSYSLASAHIKSDLEAVKNSGASQIAKVMADKGIAGLEQQGIQMRQKLAQQEATKAASALAQDRAKLKEAADYYQTQLKFYGSAEGGGLPPNEAAQAAARDTGIFHPGGNIGGKLDQIGIEAGKRAAAEPHTATSQKFEYDESGEPLVPDRDPATGRSWKSQDKQHYIALAKKEKGQGDVYDNTIKTIDEAEANADQLTKSLVQGVPFTETKQERDRLQTQWKADALTIGAAIYKAENGGVEPKNKKLVEELVAPYLPSGVVEDLEVTKHKIQTLRERYERTVGTQVHGKKSVPPVSETAKKIGLKPQQ